MEKVYDKHNTRVHEFSNGIAKDTVSELGEKIRIALEKNDTTIIKTNP